MTQEMREIIENKKGKFASVTWTKTCDTLKTCPYTITKVTTAKNIRIGAQYNNLKQVKDNREDGTLPQENQGLKGMEWTKYPVFLKGIKSGKEFLRIETAKNSQFNTQYYINGKQTDKSSILQYLKASEKKTGDMPPIINIGVNGLLRVQ